MCQYVNMCIWMHCSVFVFRDAPCFEHVASDVAVVDVRVVTQWPFGG